MDAEHSPSARALILAQRRENAVLRAERDALQDERNQLLDMVDDFLDHYAGTHERGEEIDSSYDMRTLCTEDEPCGYWPCPTERLRRARNALEPRESQRET